MHYNFKFDIIFICESWLDKSVSDGLLLFYHNDYSVLCCDRPIHGDGVCIFINKHLNCVRISSR